MSLLPPGFTAIANATTAGAIVSMMGVVVDLEEPRQTKGTDWVLMFSIDDHTTHISCRVFHRRLDRLPKISGNGDIVVLRNVKLSAWKFRVDCVTTNNSSVLAFPAKSIPTPALSQAYQLGNRQMPYSATFATTGPTSQEQMAVIRINDMRRSSLAAPTSKPDAAPRILKPKAPDKLALIKDLDFSRFYDVRAQVVNTYYTLNSAFELKVTDYTSNKDLFLYADPDKEDGYMVTDKNWTGPYGQLTLNVILYGNNMEWVRQNISVGDFVFLKNMRTKMSPRNKLEGVIHEDRERPDQVDVRRLTNRSDIEEITKRREAYEKQRGNKSALEVVQNASKKLSANAPVSKKLEKRQKQRELKEAEQKELEKKAEEWDAARSGINTNIKAAFPEMKLSTLSEIIYNPFLQTRSQNHNDYTLPFVNAKHRTRVRVVDFFPPELELFSHSSNDTTWTNRPRKQDPNSGRTIDRWEWGFVLLLEDANLPPNTVSEKLRVVVGNDVGQGLLKRNALNLKNNPQVLAQLKERLFILWGNLLELKTELRDRGSDFPLPPGDNRLLNKPFDCCIEEYGHEVPLTETNPYGYQRMHRLAQTFIMLD